VFFATGARKVRVGDLKLRSHTEVLVTRLRNGVSAAMHIEATIRCVTGMGAGDADGHLDRRAEGGAATDRVPGRDTRDSQFVSFPRWSA